MHIINTVKKFKFRAYSVERIADSKTYLYAKRYPLNAKRFLFFIFAFCSLILLNGCAQKSNLEQPNFAKQSEHYYQLAIDQYRNLIAKGKDLDKWHFELGRLYFSHGDYELAIEALKNTSDILGKKFLAISYYRLGNFTDALQIFNKSRTFLDLEYGSDKKVRDKEKIVDDEYLYYQGLTCEKLNLFDKALDIYKNIKDEKFKQKSLERINAIEKQTNLRHIKSLSPETYKILASAPRALNYPQAGALILSCDERVEISTEGTQVSSLHYIIKILNERGKEDFSETQIDYDSTYEKVELEYARTIKPDGTFVDVGTRHIRDVSKYLNFPLYSNARVYIISFPEITEGATIEYKVKVYRNQLINKKDFVIPYPLQASEPILKANFSIKLPKDNPLHIKVINDKYNNFGANLKPAIKDEGNYLIYNWQFKDIPQILPELNMPASAEVNPTILISTFDHWQDIYDWWWKLAKDKIGADKAIKDKVKELTSGLTLAQDKVKAIYNFCAQKIRYVAVEYGDAGYEPHAVSDIFKNKYGDCKDQAILLVTMLKEAGILAWPVLIPTKENYNLNADFPSMLFNHCIAAVSLNEKTVFLDPTAETCSFGDLPAETQGRKVLVFKGDAYKIEDTPLYPAEHNLNKQYIKIKLNYDESIMAEKSIFTFGIYDQAQRFWLLYTPPELIEEALKQKIQETSIGATLKNYNIKNLKDLNQPVVLSYSFLGPEYFTNAGSLRIMPQLSGIDTSLVAKVKRKYAIDFAILDNKETYLEIAIPDNFVIQYMPEDVFEDSPWLSLKVEYKRFDHSLSFKQNVELKKTKISEDEYPQFKAFFEGLAKKIKQKVVLQKLN